MSGGTIRFDSVPQNPNDNLFEYNNVSDNNKKTKLFIGCRFYLFLFQKKGKENRRQRMQ